MKVPALAATEGFGFLGETFVAALTLDALVAAVVDPEAAADFPRAGPYKTA